MTQEKLQTMIMQNFGRLKMCLMEFEKAENWSLLSSLLSVQMKSLDFSLFGLSVWLIRSV